MKLKKTQEPEMTAVSGDAAAPSVIADRFKLDIPEASEKKSSGGGASATIAVVCAVIAAALLGTTFWLIYQNLALIENV